MSSYTIHLSASKVLAEANEELSVAGKTFFVAISVDELWSSEYCCCSDLALAADVLDDPSPGYWCNSRFVVYLETVGPKAVCLLEPRGRSIDRSGLLRLVH